MYTHHDQVRIAFFPQIQNGFRGEFEPHHALWSAPIPSLTRYQFFELSLGARRDRILML